MTDAERIRRLEACVAYLTDLLTATDRHIERELMEIHEMLVMEPDDSTINTNPQETRKIRKVAGRSLVWWRSFARRDDCLECMVPSDLRQLVAEISEEGKDS